MQSTLIEIVDLCCFYFVELVDLLIGFLGTLLGLFMQDYRLFVFFLACTCIVSTTFLIDQIRALGDDIVKWKKGIGSGKAKSRKTRKKSTSGNAKSSTTKSQNKKQLSSNQSKKKIDDKGKNVVVKKNEKTGSEKIVLKKNIKTPGSKSIKVKNNVSKRKGA